MKKRILSIALVALFMVGILAGCGSSTETAQTPAAEAPSSPEKAETVDPVSVVVAHAGSEATAMHLAWLEAEKVMEDSGLFDVTIYPNGQLGSDAELQGMVQAGDINMTASTASVLSTFDPRLNVFTAPFAFPDAETAYAVLDGAFGQKMLDMLGDSGFKAIGYFESCSYRELSSTRPIRTPDDLKGLKIRVIGSPLHIKTWETLGASPTSIPFSELYGALQQGTVDAQDNPLELTISQGFYEVQKYITLTNHMFQVGMVTANPDWFNGLTAEQQQVIVDAINAGVAFQRKLAAESDAGYVATLEEAGLEVIELTDDERAAFQGMMDPVYELLAEEVGQELLDEFLAAIDAA